MKKYLILAALLAIVSVNTASSLTDVNDYEVHEWGVMVGCDEANDYLLTSRPLQIVTVKEPVLYFHSNDKKPFSLKVTFNQGSPTETYPKAESEKNVVQWKDVSFVEDFSRVSKGIWQVESHVPLDEIIDTLNNVDADEIYYNGTKSRFLFYEGEIPFSNRIELTCESENQSATVINNYSYPVLDIFVIHSEPTDFLFQRECAIAYIPKLNPGEKIQVKLGLTLEKINFTKPLQDLGFTEKEMQSFASLWSDSFLEYGRLIYRLPEGECDRLIKLEFNPRPKRVARALYVLVKY